MKTTISFWIEAKPFDVSSCRSIRYLKIPDPAKGAQEHFGTMWMHPKDMPTLIVLEA
jgi:hypothetical protein